MAEMTLDQQKALAMAAARMRAAQVQPTQPDQPTQDNQGTLGNIALGALKGASDIGATLLSPVDKVMDWVNPSTPSMSQLITGKKPLTHNEQRRAALGQFFKENADPSSLAFQGGSLGAQIAGTAGVGGALANGVRAVPMLAKAIPALPAALETGGFRLGTPAATTLAGKVGNAALRAGAGAAVGGASAGLVDPNSAATGALVSGALPGGAKVVGAVGKGAKQATGFLTKKIIGGMTGVGDEALSAAVDAGRTGNQAFLDNMRGKVPMTDVLDNAKAALGQMRQNRAAEYRNGMAAVSGDKTVLDFTPIMDEVQKLRAIGSFKGKPINKNAASTVDEIAQQVDEWAKANPADFHTPEGLDALKQSIGDIRDATQFGTPARRAADQVYHAVKNQITKQAPSYAKTMKSYSEASDLISEIERSLVGKDKTSADTAMRKLQSLMRNNVNTNYGNRMNLARELERQGGQDILPAVAGQAMNDVMPRGLARLGQAGIGLTAISNPYALLGAPLTSPRLMGEAAYRLGQTEALPGLLSTKIGQLPGAQGLLPQNMERYLSLIPSAAGVGVSR